MEEWYLNNQFLLLGIYFLTGMFVSVVYHILWSKYIDLATPKWTLYAYLTFLAGWHSLILIPLLIWMVGWPWRKER